MEAVSQKAERVLRSYLIRCHSIISDDYPEIAGMAPANAADYLLHLQRTGRIRIELMTRDTSSVIECRIVSLSGGNESDELLS